MADQNALRCADCGTEVPVADGIADFVGADLPLPNDPLRYGGDPDWDPGFWTGMFDRVRAAAGQRWPQSLGDVLELGCGRGQMTGDLVGSGQVRRLLAVDTDMAMLLACRDRLSALGREPDDPPLFAALSGHDKALRDAVADTVAGVTVLTTTGDVRGLLATVHRVLRPGGRAFFVVQNRRYRQALCHAMALALAQLYARDSAWPEGHYDILAVLAQTRRIIVHRGDPGFLAALHEKHVFDSEALEDMAREVGFGTADMIPLDPDPIGAATALRRCQAIGVPDETINGFAPLVAAIGQPYLSLLGQQDSSALMLLWVSKAQGPRVAVYNARPPLPAIPLTDPRAVLAGAQPRWSLELLAKDTPDGIDLQVGGWCLANIDVIWVRVTLDGVTLNASVWRPRPDVHEVLNSGRQYHPLNAMCSGIETEMLFDGVHPTDGRCSFKFDVVLVNGVIVSGPAPDTLIMGEPTVIAH